MTADYELLGAAEKHVAKELTEAVEACRVAVKKLDASLDACDLDELESVMLDSKGKEGLITTVPLVQNLAKSLQMAELTTLLLGIMVKPSKEKAS